MVEVQVVGAGALNQAIKAVAIARGYLAPSGVDLVCVPSFADIEIDGERRTALRLLCEDRSGLSAPAAPAAAVVPTVDLRAAEAAKTAEAAMASERIPAAAEPGHNPRTP
jgi:hypothetical protein